MGRAARCLHIFLAPVGHSYLWLARDWASQR